jgi:hypothetical protein
MESNEQIQYPDNSQNCQRLIDDEGYAYGVKHTNNRSHVIPYHWNPSTLSYEVSRQAVINTDTLTVLGEMDLLKYGGVLVGIDNAIHVQPGTGAEFIIKGKTTTSTYQVPRLDPYTHTLTTIDIAHSKIHTSESFFIKDWVTLTNGQILNFVAITPDTTKTPHLVMEFNFQAEANIAIYEGATLSNNGTAITSFNRDRNSDNAATTLVYHTPTITTDGTLIARYKAGSGKSIGGSQSSRAELKLKRNTKYIIRVTNDTVSNNWMGYLADWYEHTNLTP